MSVQPGTPPGDRPFRHRIANPQSVRLSAPDLVKAPDSEAPAVHEITSEPGFATFARWQRKRFAHQPHEVTDAFLGTTWTTGSVRWKAAWADVEDWHPAIREQCALLDRASEAMEALTEERDDARALNADILDPVRWTEDRPYAVLRVSVDHLAAWRQQAGTEPKP